VREAELLVGHLAAGGAVVGENGRIRSLVEDLELRDDDLDLAGDELGVLAAGTDADRALDGDHVLVSEVVGGFEDVLGEVLAVEDDLGESVAVTEIDEDEAGAVAAISVDPSVETDGLADVGLAKFAAGVSSTEHVLPIAFPEAVRRAASMQSIGHPKRRSSGPKCRSMRTSLHRLVARRTMLNQTSITIATALPPPRHRAATPRLPPVRWSWWMRVVSTRAPEPPMGWPSAMPPPQMLSLDSSILEFLDVAEDLGREGLVDLEEVDVLGR
jgi:hypothetical protein